MDAQQATLLAIKALGYVAADSERFGKFLAESGFGAEALREAAGDPDLLAGVLDFVLSEDAMVLELCQLLDLPPEAPARARANLPGYAPPM